MLFDSQDNMNYFIKDFVDMENNNLSNNSNGLIQGNMFNNEYLPYKDIYPSKIEVNNEKEDLILKLYETNFAIIDLGLYLDLHPQDSNIFNTFKKNTSEFEKYKDLYEKKYGPLMITCASNNNYDWINNPWPWDNDGGNKYV